MGLAVPAVLPSSHHDLEEKLALLATTQVTRVQIDIVDQTFAQTATWPFNAPAELHTMVLCGEMLPHLDRIVYEIDIMCRDAESVAGEWLALGATRLTFHAESERDLPRLLASARQRYGAGSGFASGLVSFGLALGVASDLALIEPCLKEVEYVQFMGIAQIGKQGQPFDRRVLEKVRLFRSRHPEISLQVDGGVTPLNARELVALGVSNLVIGSAILQAKDLSAIIAEFEALQTSFGV